MTGRFTRQTGYYADSPAGHGARQSPSRLINKARYRQRAEGKIPPVEYRPLDEVPEVQA